MNFAEFKRIEEFALCVLTLQSPSPHLIFQLMSIAALLVPQWVQPATWCVMAVCLSVVKVTNLVLALKSTWLR
nr:MAG TPA_asm: hypothetical protein [Caudoviricetes sp.]